MVRALPISPGWNPKPSMLKFWMDAMSASTRVPLIGIGAGTRCHGQVLVVQDLLGMSDQTPRFAAPAAALGDAIVSAGREWVRRVASGEIGRERYRMRAGEAERFGAAGPGAPEVKPASDPVAGR